MLYVSSKLEVECDHEESLKIVMLVLQKPYE